LADQTVKNEILTSTKNWRLAGSVYCKEPNKKLTDKRSKNKNWWTWKKNWQTVRSWNQGK